MMPVIKSWPIVSICHCSGNLQTAAIKRTENAGANRNGLLIATGVLSLLLGTLGIFLPVLPTVPFVLLASFCFARSSERFHSLLITNRHFGLIIQNYESGRGIPRRVKLRAITLLWLSMAISAWLIDLILLRFMLAAIGLGVSIYLYRLPEYKADEAA